MRARTKFVVVLLGITVILGGVVAGSHELSKRQAVEAANEEVDATVELTADQIDAAVRERQDYVGYVASQTTDEDFDRSEEVLLEITRSSRFYAAQLVDEEGTVVDFQGDVAEDVRRDALGTVSEEPYVEAALEGRTYVSEPEEATDGHVVVVSAPILKEDGTVIGAIAAAMFVDQQTVLQSTRPLETSSQTVSVTGPNDERIKPAEKSFDAAIAGTSTVETAGWTVTIHRDRSELTGRLRGLAIVQGASLAIVLVTIVGFGFWEYRTNLRQAERLLEGFNAITRGDYDFRLSLSSAEEWQQISDGFGDLATGLAEREAALREREQRLDVLNRVLRHNLRNEMVVVVNYAELIGEVTDDGQIESAAEAILESGRDLTALSEKANQIRTAFDAADRLVRFDAADLVDEVVDRVSTEYPDVRVGYDAPEDVSVVGIPALGVAVENLVENACKYNDAAEPTVDVRVTPDDGSDAVRLTVVDNGPGIPEQEYRVLEKGEETALEHGSGLGLWLVHWVVERSDGVLRFGENEPRGTVVTVELTSGDVTGDSAAISTDPSSAIGD